jgi:hypothetical protein
MTGVNSEELGILPKVVVAVAISLVAAGVLWHGVTVEALQRLWGNLVDRPRAARWRSASSCSRQWP